MIKDRKYFITTPPDVDQFRDRGGRKVNNSLLINDKPCLGLDLKVNFTTCDGHFKENSALDIYREAFFLAKFVFLNS